VDKAVKEVAETEERLEMFKMFCCGVGVAKHREPISSLVASEGSQARCRQRTQYQLLNLQAYE